MGNPADPITSASGPVHRRMRSHIYVLHEYVGGRPTADAAPNKPLLMLQKYRSEIHDWIPALYTELSDYEGKTLHDRKLLAEWYHLFMSDYRTGALSLTLEKRGKGYERIPRFPKDNWSDRIWAVAGLVDARGYGITQIELKQRIRAARPSGLSAGMSNGPTGALSMLHAADLIARLEEKR